MFFYFRHTLNQIFRTFFVLVCADRYACCSDRSRVRAFSQYRVAIRLIPAVWIFWLLVSILPTLTRQLYDGVCDAFPGIYDIMYTTYLISVAGIIPLLAMIVFGILMLQSLRKTRRRILPTAITNTVDTGTVVLRKRDRDMMKMLLIELVICTITLAPNTITRIYKSVIAEEVVSKERQQIESFIFYLTRIFLLYMANTFSFWVYISTSQTYRQELKTLFIKWYRFVVRC